MSLVLSAQPGFTDLADSTFDAGATPSSATLKALNADAKFGAVRNEQFWGFYKNGETVATPVSPADGYIYSRAELLYTWSLVSTASHPAALNGSQVTPTPGANSGAGTLISVNGIVDQSTGLVTSAVSYFSGTQTNTSDGIWMVMVHAQRSR